MKRYEFKLNQYREKFEKKTDEEKAREVTDTIKLLKDESFGNFEQRKKFAKSIYKIINSKESESKFFIKKLGDIISNWSDGNFNKEEKE